MIRSALSLLRTGGHRWTLVRQFSPSLPQSTSTTGYTAAYFEDKLRRELSAEHLDIVDISCGCGAKFDSLIVSKHFEGKSLIQRHRLVNELINEELKAIHAFSMRTLTPEQWTKELEQLKSNKGQS